MAKVKERPDQPNKQQKIEHHSNTNGSGEDMTTRSLSLYNDDDNDSSWDDINSTSTPNVSTLSWEGLNDQLRFNKMYLNICQISLFSTTAKNLMESLQKDELEKEQSLNRELHSRLMEKENQLNISERQNEKLRRQNATINTLVKIQDEQIKKLKLELSKASDKATKNGDFDGTEYGHNSGDGSNQR